MSNTTNPNWKGGEPMESLIILLALLAGITGLIATLIVVMILLATFK